MKVKENDYDVGVIVARFQVHELHKAHKDLIQTVVDRHDKVIIFLGLSPLMVTKENPLDFESRKQMILEKFPNVMVLYTKDTFSDEAWSKKFDEQIGDLITPSQSVVLYGSRDSFQKHYLGKYQTLELKQEVYISGTETRKQISRKVRSSADFRAGVVWASASRFPTSYQTVDVAIFSEDNNRLLLGRKPGRDKYCFVGGFVDPTDTSLEEAARREVKEEASINVAWPKYLGSFRIDDWRYKGEQDSILTALFVAHYDGEARAGDDIAEVRWFDVSNTKAIIDLMDNKLSWNHRLLASRLFDRMEH